MTAKNQKPEIRKSYIFNTYSIIAPRRDLRPRDIEEFASEKSKAHCPFCPGHLPAAVILKKISPKNEPTEQILVVKNIFPAAAPDAPRAYGDQEVIIETKNHDKKMTDFSVGHIKATLEMNFDRFREYLKNPRLKYFLAYKNQGPRAGASLKHPHSQNLTTAEIPTAAQEELKILKAYRVKHKVCAYCQILKDELKSARKIYSDKYIGIFAPYASQYHFEAWIFPKRHVSNPLDLTAAELTAMAKGLKILVKKIDKLNISFNYFFQYVRGDKNQHFHIKFQPRDATWAGVELGSGWTINEIAPETAAKFYRQ
jgi:UDPglucose--hexose-1-phosphate uridylyltransferase